jgi:ABC-type molybdate transport system substrate-binding protein
MLTPNGLSYGAQARTLLSRLHLGRAAPRARPGPANPVQLAAQVAAGKADAGIVVTPDAASVAAKLRRIAFPARSRPTVRFQIAAVRGAPHPRAAAAYIRHVRSTAGRTALREAGFGTR